MKNKYKARQSVVKWLIWFVVLLAVDLLFYSLSTVDDSLIYKICIWVVLFGVSLGLIVMLGTFIWSEVKGSLLIFDFDRKVIIMKNPVLFRKKTTEVQFDEIAKAHLSNLGMFKLFTVKTNKPHENSGMTTDNGMTVSINLYFVTKKSFEELKNALTRLQSELKI